MNGKNWIFGAVAAVGCAVALLSPRPAAAHCYDEGDYGGGYGYGWHARQRCADDYDNGDCYRRHYRRTVVVYRTVPVYRTVAYYPAYRHRCWHRRRRTTRVYVSIHAGWHARHRYGCY